MRRPTRYLRIAVAATAALVTLVFLLTLLNQHFMGTTHAWKTSRIDRREEQGRVMVREPFLARNMKLSLPSTAPDRTIHAGIHVENVYGLSLKDRVFMAEGWYWLKWPEAINAILKSNNVSQERIVEFPNLVESSSMLVEADQPVPERLSDGQYWQLYRFSGKFYIDDLDLHSFPFQSLHLPIMLELLPDYLSCYPDNPFGCISLRLEKDEYHQVLGAYAGLNGYRLLGAESEEFLHQYPTNFGRGDFSAYASVEANIVYQTIFSASFWTYIFPLLVMIGIALLSPSLSAMLGDVRLAIPTTILLTLIFLQIGYRADLPALAYVTFLDWLYIYAYVLSAVLFLLFCWGANAHSLATSSGGEEVVVRKIDRVDSFVQIVGFGGLLLMLASGLAFQP